MGIIAAAATAIGSALASGAGAVAAGATAAGGAIASGAGALGGAIASGAGALGSAIGTGASALGGAIGSGASAIGSAAGTVGNAIASGAGALGNAIGSGASALGNAIGLGGAEAGAAGAAEAGAALGGEAGGALMSSLPQGNALTAALNTAQFGSAPLSSSAGIVPGSLNQAIAAAGGAPVGGIAAPMSTVGEIGSAVGNLPSGTTEGFDVNKMLKSAGNSISEEEKKKQEEERRKREAELQRIMGESQNNASNMGGYSGGNKSYNDIMGLYRR